MSGKKRNRGKANQTNQSSAQPAANVASGSSNVPVPTVQPSQQNVSSQPTGSVASGSSTLAVRTAPPSQQHASSQPKTQEQTGLIKNFLSDRSSHRNQEGITQMPLPRGFPTGQERLAFAFQDKGDSLDMQNRANLESQRKQTLLGDASATHDHHVVRPGLAEHRDQTLILTNHFKVTIPQGKTLYEYRVQNFPAKASRNKRRMMILDMIEIDNELFRVRDTIATDYREKIISCTPLFTVTSAPLGQSVHTVKVNNFEPGSRSDQPAMVELEILYVAKHELDGLRDFVEGRNEAYKDTGAKEAMNITIAKSVSDPTNNKDTFQVGDNRFFYRPGWSEIPSANGLVVMRGYFSTIRPAMNSILLNVNIAHGAFYKAQGLFEYLEDYRRNRKYPYDGLTEADFDVLKGHLCGLRVSLNFDRSQADDQGEEFNTPARRNKLICDLGDVPRIQKFSMPSNPRTVVWDHLKGKYGDVKNDKGEDAVDDLDMDLPTVNVGQKKRNQKFYLPRQLDVLSDQLYRGQLSARASSDMIGVAKKLPEENYRAIVQEGLRCLRLLPDMPRSQMMSDIGMTIEQKLVQLYAHVYEQPKVVYSKRPVQPTWGYWVIPNEAKFFDVKPGSGKGVTRVFYPALAHKDGKFKRPPLSDYVELLRDIHSGLGGISLPHDGSIVEVQDWSVGNLGKVIDQQCNKDDLAIAIFPKENKEQRSNYTNFKIAVDQKLGFTSICLSKDKMDEQLGKGDFKSKDPWPKKIKDYFCNVSMKLNVRSGGINHVIDRESLPVIGQDVICNTMIIGADVTHSSPGSAGGTPSIAAFVGSMDEHFARFVGQVRLNPPRTEVIGHMKAMVRGLLNNWYNENDKKMPARILFYRDGVGDSQYAEVRKHEVTAIRDAWQEYKASRLKKCPNADFPENLAITAVVVTKRHHTRLYPSPITKSVGRRDKVTMTKSRNCLPGTVADRAITSPYYFDFFLLSHNVPGETGTSKPTHYFVLENEMGFSPQELQKLTFMLCFMYCRSTTSVSYVPATYYADRLCERARLYLQPFHDRDEEGDQELSDDQVFREAEKLFYRGGGERENGSEGRPANPWHKNLDEEMFWL
jgi:eukaryotic translation initiation factor 2C